MRRTSYILAQATRSSDCPPAPPPPSTLPSPPPPSSFPCYFKLPRGNEEVLTCGNLTEIHWAGWMRSASCHQRPPLSLRHHCPHCHPKSDTHKRRLIGCTLERFHPPLHMTEYWTSQWLVFATQSTVPAYIQGFNDKRAVNIWRFGTGCICCTVAGYLNRPAGILCVRMCVLSFQKPVFTETLMWEWYVAGD